MRNLKTETVGEATLPEEIFGVPFRRHLVWEVVKEIRAREHRGTHKTKVRSEVSGSGKKPFKQKHTGRARQGGGRPPIHRHGGTVFGPSPHSYDLKVNAKAKKAALRCVLSEKAREQPGRPPRRASSSRTPQDEGLRGRAREARRRGEGARPRPEGQREPRARRREQPEARDARRRSASTSTTR